MAYDISTFSSIEVIKNVSDQEAAPSSMIFNDDGTRLYVMGISGDDINQYDLSTAYDISTATFEAVVLDVSNQESRPSSMLFNDDGSRLYVMGENGLDINQYELSTAYDISTATFEAVVLDFGGGQENLPFSMLFNDDGSRLYVMGTHGDDIDHYDLSTDYDISTATFEAVVLDVSNQESRPTSMIFNNDGSRLYVMGTHGDDINQYDLSTDYDISTATFEAVVLEVNDQENSPTSMIFNNDGSRLYVMGTHGADINQYDLEEVLSLGDVHLDRQTLYPNPVQEKLYVLGLTNPQPYTLYNLLGSEVANGSVSENTPIAVRALTNGLYFLRLESGLALKFIKK
jgi:sugar lactone lactonase YvrE